MNFKKSCILCRNFIGIYKINRKLHGRLGIRISSSRAESIPHSFASLTHERCFQHSTIKFVSPRGHVISSTILFSYISDFRFRFYGDELAPSFLAWKSDDAFITLHGFSLASKVRNELSLIRLRFWWKEIDGNLTREICVPLHRYVV